MIVIVGGGICGLSIGWYLARAGRAVIIVERGACGAGATWAAAGMLAANIEAEPSEEKLVGLLRESQRAWPDFAAELERAAKMKIGLRQDGTLAVAFDRDDGEQLRHRYEFQRGLGLPVEWISAAQARRLEPALARNLAGGIHSPEDHQVDNRLVAVALKAAYLAAGGALREQTNVDEIVVAGDRVRGVRANGALVEAETVVLAAGAWSRNVPGLPDALRPPVRPLKGQMLALAMPPSAPLIRHVVWGPDVYLVPRDDGRLLIGATVEEAGFEAAVTAGGMRELLDAAWEVLPGIDELPVVETWAGLRPTSRDDAPILGPSGVSGLVYATGHHRNGILLAPLTARVIADYILTGRLAQSVHDFGLRRFAA